MFDQTLPTWQKNLSSKLAAALGIQPEEETAVWLLFGHSFFVGVAMISLYISANALFLAEFDSDMVSYVYIVAAVTTILVGLLFSRLQTRISFGTSLVAVVGFLLVSVLILRIGLWLTNSKWIAFLLMVWVRLFWILANLELFALAGRLFNVRQGKRLFPLITASAVIAVIFLGLSASLLIDLLGTANLLWVTIGSLGFVLFFLLKTLQAFRPQITAVTASAPEPSSKKIGEWDLFRDPYIRLIIISALLIYIGAQVVDFAFINQAGEQFTDVDALGQFFGNYLGASTLVNLLFLALVSGRLLNRYGIKIGVLARPGLIALGAIATILASGFSAPTVVIFWLVVMTRLFDEVTATGMMNISLRVLYQVLPLHRRVSAQAVVETFIGPLAMAISGVMLLIFASLPTFTVIHAVYLLFVIMTGGVISAVLLGRQYNVALQKALVKRFLGQTDLALEDKSSLEMLHKQLASPRPEEVIFAMTMLVQADYDQADTLLLSLLHHTAPQVRQEALHQIEKRQPSGALAPVLTLIQQEENPHIKAAALQTLCALGDAQGIEAVTSYLDDPDRQVRLGAMAGLLRYGGVPQIVQTGHRLLEMIDAPQAADRILAAQVLGEVGLAGFQQQLMPLLKDKELRVQQAALQAAGKLKSSRLWPLVVAKLAQPETREAAFNALVAGDTSVLPALQAAFAQANTPQAWLPLIKVCGRLGGADTAVLLIDKITCPDPHVRTRILRALTRCRYQAGGQERERVAAHIQTEIDTAGWLLTSWADVADDDKTEMLQQALTAQINACCTRLFYLLSFLYDASVILQVQSNLQHGSLEKQAYAQEALDLILSKTEKAALVPWLVHDSPETMWHQLRPSLSHPTLTLKDRLQTLITTQAQSIDAWTRVCALYAVARLSMTSLLDTVITASAADDPLIQETAKWVSSRLAPDEYDSQMYSLSDIRTRQKKGKKRMLLTIERVMILKTVSIFTSIPDNVLAELATFLEEVLVDAGDTIFQKGDVGDCMYIIVSGRVRIHDGEHTLNHLGERAIFGEMAALAPEPRMASITAVEDTHLLRLRQEPLYELIDDYREVAHGIIQVLSQRLRAVQDAAHLPSSAAP